MPNLFVGHVAGDILPAADWNTNFNLAESSFADAGPVIVSGLVQSAGTGLSVNVTAGNALIGGDVVKASSWTITSLTDAAVNHLWLLQNGTGASNTTGTAPSNSVKLGTATTAGGVVTSVNITRSSGRQAQVRTENLIPGGPAAGNPPSIDLSQWAASAGNSVTVFGNLPSGAVSGMTPPITYTLDDANQSSVQTTLTVAHTYNAGGGATGIGVGLNLVAESATNGTLRTAGAIQASLTDATAATASSQVATLVLDNNSQVTPLIVASKKTQITQGAATAAQYGLLNIGSGGFSGSAGHFAGAGQGTLLALNAPSGFTGYLASMQVNGVSLWLVQNNAGFLTNTPNAAANFGLMNLGDTLGIFDGSSTGHFVGSASGTYLAINSGSSFAGDLVRFQHQGNDRYRQTDVGDVTMVARDAATTTITTGLTVIHKTTGTPAANFGTQLQFQMDNSSNAPTNVAAFQALWSSPTAGNENSLLKWFLRYNGTDVEVARIRPVGTIGGGFGGTFQVSSDFLHAGTLLGFYNGTPTAKGTITGSRGANAALASLLTYLASIGLLTDSST